MVIIDEALLKAQSGVKGSAKISMGFFLSIVQWRRLWVFQVKNSRIEQTNAFGDDVHMEKLTMPHMTIEGLSQHIDVMDGGMQFSPEMISEFRDFSILVFDVCFQDNQQVQIRVVFGGQSVFIGPNIVDKVPTGVATIEPNLNDGEGGL